MKYFLYCPVKDCTFSLGIEYTASEAECCEVTNKIKSHIKVKHTLDEIVDSLFMLLMHVTVNVDTQVSLGEQKELLRRTLGARN